MSNEKIDKDGNPITEEVVTPVELSPEEIQKIVSENETLNQTKEKLVDEVKELRGKKQLSEQERDEALAKLEKKVETPEDKPDVLNQVKDLLQSEKVAAIKKNKEKAMNKFLAKHPEFSESNDEAGLKKSALDKKLAMFNTDSLTDEDEFLSIYENAFALIGKKEVMSEDTPEVVTTPITTKTPNSENTTKLSPEEIEIVKTRFGGNEKRYLELKAKYPDVVKVQ
jgi:hypothetical protein